jgi:hypothetical protein
MLDIVIRINCQRNKQTLSMQIAFFCGINYCMFSWKPTRANVGENQNLPQTQIEMRS